MFLGDVNNFISHSAIKYSFAIIGFLCCSLSIIVDFPPVHIGTDFIPGNDDKKCANDQSKYEYDQPKGREATPMNQFTRK